MDFKPRLIIAFIRCLLISFFLANSHTAELEILTEEWAPISFSKNGYIDGLGVEIVREILRRINTPDTIKIYPWARAWKMLTTKENVVVFTVTSTNERKKLFTMIGPIAIGTTNFYAKKGSQIHIKNLEDAKKVKIIGVYRDAVEEQILTKEGFTNIEATTIPLHSARKLMMDRIQLWCNANFTVESILKEAGFSGDEVKLAYTIRENHLYIGFSKNTPETIINSWQNALESMKKDGVFDYIYKKWLPEDIPPKKTERIGILH